MSLMDEFAAKARARDTYSPELSAMRGSVPTAKGYSGNTQVLQDLLKRGVGSDLANRGTSGQVPSFDPLGPTPGGIQRSVAAKDGQAAAIAKVRALEAAGYLQKKDESGYDLGDLGSSIAKGFGKVIDAVDTPRALVVSTLKEIADKTLDSGDGDWSWGDLYQNTKDNYGAGDLAEQVLGSDSPMWLKRTIGFAGDVLTDPLMWTTGGTLAAIKGGTKAGGKLAAKEMGEAIIDQSLKQAGRKGIASAVSRRAAALDLAGELTEAELKAAQKWATKGGTHGRAMLKKSARAEAGVDDALLKKLGVNSKLGYSFGTKSHRLNIPGTERFAGLLEGVKGSIKSDIAKTSLARKMRATFTADDEVFGNLYREAVTSVLEGAADAPQAAMSLAHISQAKAMSHMWADSAVKELETNMSWIGKGKGKSALSADEGAQLLDLIQTGAHKGVKPDGVSDELFRHAQELGGWFEKNGQFLVDNGVNMSLRANYIPHIRSEDWIKYEMAQGEWSDAYRKVSGQPKDKSFTMQRNLEEGDIWFGEPLKAEDLNVAGLNRISEKVAGFKALVDDPQQIVAGYISSARTQLLKDNLFKLNADAGFVKGKTKVLDAAKNEKQIIKELEEATKVRKAALTTVIDNTKVGVKKAREVMKQVAAEGKKYDDLVVRHEAKVSKLQAKLDSFQSAREQLAGLDTKRLKTETTLKIQNLDAEIAATQAGLSEATGKLARARSAKSKAGWAEKQANAEAALKKLESDLAGAQATRDGLETLIPGTQTPLPRRAGAKPEQGVIRTEAQAKAGVKKVLSEISEANREQFAVLGIPGESPSTLTYWTRDTGSIGKDLSEAGLNAKEEARLYGQAAEFLAGNKAVKVGKTEVEKEARNELLVDQVGIVSEAMETLGETEVHKMVLGMEAQALVYDANTAMLRQSAQQIRDGVQSALDNPKFQDRIMLEVEAGFRELDAATQALPFYAEAMKKVPDIRVPSERAALKKALKSYDRGMNVWKSWATGSPGFVVRNMYSGMFNMYLDGVDPKNFHKMQRFLKEYEGWRGSSGGRGSGGLEAAKNWARREGFSERDIGYFEGALEAAAGSGWGLTPIEVQSKLAAGETAGLLQKINPVNESFSPTASIRSQSSNMEAKMRAGHAFDVLVKGGDVATAVERLEKFHFNYRDISQLDRAMKRVMPFWMFYSRNMALQANVWTRMPDKLNRSYYNYKRNVELGVEVDDLTPRYFEEMGAVATSLGEPGGSQWSTTWDIPSLRFIKDVGDLGDPAQIASSFAAPIKTVIENVQDRRLFTDAPFKDRLYDFDGEGDPYARKASRLLQIPGVRNLIEGAGDVAGNLPGLSLLGEGMEMGPDGSLLWTDRMQAAVEDFAPLLGRVGKLAPNNPKDQGRVVDRWLSFGGIPVKQTTDEMRQGEQYRRSLDVQEQAKRIRAQNILENL